jgi:fumarate reductase flavoprotein subunit
MNPELTFALRIKNMLRLSLITAMGGLARTESRGAHFRLDYPLRNDAEWLNRTLARWPESSNEPEISYEPVGNLDVPPGHRGYGADERIEMKLSIAEYNATVEEGQAKQGKLPAEGVL